MNCKNCSKEFNSNNKNRPNIFCSLGCWREYEHKKAYKNKCLICEKKILNKKKYCSNECYYKSLKKNSIGKNNPHFKKRIVKVCPICKKEFNVLPSRIKKTYCSKYCSYKRIQSEEQRKKAKEVMMCRNLVGKNNPSWKGGITKLTLRIRESSQYNEWRKAVYGRDNYKCVKCKINNNKLEAHHKNPFNIILKNNKIKTLEEAVNCKELWDIENGETLCIKCHKKTDSYGKNRKDNVSCTATIYNLTK